MYGFEPGRGKEWMVKFVRGPVQKVFIMNDPFPQGGGVRGRKAVLYVLRKYA